MDELIAAIKLVLGNMTAYHAQLAACQLDIQKILNDEIQNKSSKSDQVMIAIADLVNLDVDSDVSAFRQYAKKFMSHHYALQNLTERTVSQIDTIVDRAIVEYSEDMRAKFNILAVSEYALRVNEKAGMLLGHIEDTHQKYLESYKRLDKALSEERPDQMNTIQGYNEYSKILMQVKCLVGVNNEKIDYALGLLKQSGNIMWEGMKKPDISQKASGFTNTIKRIVKYSEPNEKELFSLLEQCHTFLQAIIRKFPTKIVLFEMNFASLDALLGSYQELMDSMETCCQLIADSTNQPIPFQSLFNKKFIEALRKEKVFNAGQIEAGQFFERHNKAYSEAYDNTYAAIQLLGNAAKNKITNEKLLEITIPKMEKIIAERVKVKKREEAFIKEKLSFSRGEYANVKGEVYKKLRDKFLCTGKSRQIIQLLLKHAEGHVKKGGLIKSFLVSLENMNNLGDFINIMGVAVNFAELMECKTELGRRLRIMSTTGGLVNKLNEEFKKIIKEEKEQMTVFNGVKAGIEDEKASIFQSSESSRFDVIYKDFIATVEQQYSDNHYIAQLKEELISIGLWTAKNESKVSRLALVLEKVKSNMLEEARKKHVEPTPVYYSLNQFSINHANALKDIAYHQNEFPFTFRYQMLRNKLSTVKTFREQTLNELWQALDRVASSDASELSKMDRMRETLNAFYMTIRESTNGSAGMLFSRGSRLGNALREFMLAKDGFFMREEYVPQRVGFRFF